MPRYFLSLRQGEKLSRDLEGERFDDLEHAVREAACWARELAGAAVTNDEPVRGHVEIADNDGKILATLILRDTVRF